MGTNSGADGGKGRRRPDKRGQEGAEEHGTPEQEKPEEGESGTDWDALVLDEQFVRGAEVNEPAARTRMLQERWKDKPPEPQPWRADQPPAGWFFSKARRKQRRRRKKRD